MFENISFKISLLFHAYKLRSVFLWGIVEFRFRFPTSRTYFFFFTNLTRTPRLRGSSHRNIAAFETSVTSAFTASSLLQNGDFFTSAKSKLFRAGFVLGRYFKICIKNRWMELSIKRPNPWVIFIFLHRFIRMIADVWSVETERFISKRKQREIMLIILWLSCSDPVTCSYLLVSYGFKLTL